MAVIHISEADAIRDFASVLAQVRAGSEIIIDSGQVPIAVLVSPSEQAAAVASAHDSWFRSLVQEALDDTRPGIPCDEVEAHFAHRRAGSLHKIENSAR